MREAWCGRLRGTLSLVVRRRGAEDMLLDGPNLVLAAATAVAHRALAGDAGATISRVALGTSTQTPSPDDVGAVGDSVEVAVQSVTHPSPNETRVVFVLPEGAGNSVGSVGEFVLLTQDGTAFARTTRGPILKNETVEIQGTWTISGTLSDGGV
jgi:hypothetical protein